MSIGFGAHVVPVLAVGLGNVAREAHLVVLASILLCLAQLGGSAGRTARLGFNQGLEVHFVLAERLPVVARHLQPVLVVVLLFGPGAPMATISAITVGLGGESLAGSRPVALGTFNLNVVNV
jgi:hypothetical protein